MSTAIAPTPLTVEAIDDDAMRLRIRRWLRYRRELAGFLIDVLCVLVAERATGRLTINLTQGVAASAEFEQRERIMLTDQS